MVPGKSISYALFSLPTFATQLTRALSSNRLSTTKSSSSQPIPFFRHVRNYSPATVALQLHIFTKAIHLIDNHCRDVLYPLNFPLAPYPAVFGHDGRTNVRCSFCSPTDDIRLSDFYMNVTVPPF
jgi:hypothetical protein